MPANEDKENNIVYTGNESSSTSFPQTPAHLLKRSHSNVLKPPVRLDQLKKDVNSNSGKNLKYIQGGKEVRPRKDCIHTHSHKGDCLWQQRTTTDRKALCLLSKLQTRIKMRKLYRNNRILYLHAKTTSSESSRRSLAIVIEGITMAC